MAAKKRSASKMVTGSKSLGAEMMRWGAGGDALMSVGSHFYGGHQVPAERVRAALSLARTLRAAYPRDASLKRIDTSLSRMVSERKSSSHRANPAARRGLTLAQARAEFRDNWLPPNPGDRPGVRLAWSMFVDSLRRDGRITERQAQTWDIPENFARPRKSSSHRANPIVDCRGKSDTYNRYRSAMVLHNGEWVKVDGCWAGAPAKVPSYHGTVKRTGKGTTISKKVVRQKASRTAGRVKGVRARSRK